MRTNYAGAVGSSYKALPWGDGYLATVNSSGADQDNEHFAGLERDAESGTEHAVFRNYASAQGRWLAPDSYLGSYDFTNPESMNRYSYALNNPSSFVDPSGLDTSVSDAISNLGLRPLFALPPSPPLNPCVIFPDICGGIPPWWCLEFGWRLAPTSDNTPGPGGSNASGPLHLARLSNAQRKVLAVCVGQALRSNAGSLLLDGAGVALTFSPLAPEAKVLGAIAVGSASAVVGALEANTTSTKGTVGYSGCDCKHLRDSDRTLRISARICPIQQRGWKSADRCRSWN